jgi:hypothetical protein
MSTFQPGDIAILKPESDDQGVPNRPRQGDRVVVTAVATEPRSGDGDDGVEIYLVYDRPGANVDIGDKWYANSGAIPARQAVHDWL